MIAKVRLLLDYGADLVWIYDENDVLIDNALPPEWRDDEELDDARMAVMDMYESFFINNKHEFVYVGPKDEEARRRFRSLAERAVAMVEERSTGRYAVQNDIDRET